MNRTLLLTSLTLLMHAGALQVTPRNAPAQPAVSAPDNGDRPIPREANFGRATQAQRAAALAALNEMDTQANRCFQAGERRFGDGRETTMVRRQWTWNPRTQGVAQRLLRGLPSEGRVTVKGEASLHPARAYVCNVHVSATGLWRVAPPQPLR